MINNKKISGIERLKDIFNTPDEKSAIKVACRQVLATLQLSNAPIPLKPICDRFNLKVVYNNVIKKEDSFLKLIPNGFQIEISKQKNWRRNRFTIAHEIVHLIIFKFINNPIDVSDRKHYNAIERLCDIGASELLISQVELEKELKFYNLGTNGLKAIYDKFLVSYEAIFQRLSELFKANILIWRKHARHNSENKELRVYKHFPSYHYSEKSTWLPIGCTTKHISPVPFEMLKSGEFMLKNTGGTLVIDDFKIIMNDKMTDSKCITFMFPHSRNLSNALPTFDNLTITDEYIYDDCYVMFVFVDEQSFRKVLINYLSYDNG